jgi:NAD(P)-dependent dehydrogenase (short-subunit alcohol dehydrogenase family)
MPAMMQGTMSTTTTFDHKTAPMLGTVVHDVHSDRERTAAERMAHIEPIGEECGVIVDTASVAAFDGQIGQPAYSASKDGVAAMTLPIARELGRHLTRAVIIAQGIVETPMMAGLPAEAHKSQGTQVPHPSPLGKPDEYGALAVHIVENDAQR